MNFAEIITSRENAKLQTVRRIRDGKESELIFIEGERLAEEVLRSEIEIVEVFVDKTKSFDSALTNQLSERSNVFIVASKAFNTIADTENSQGIVLIATRPKHDILTLGSKYDKGILIYLHEINNPANLGAVVRTAEAAGVLAVAVSHNSADAFSPKAIRASMGSCFRLPLVEHISYAEIEKWAVENSFITTAADLSAAVSYTEIDWKIPRILVFGSEAHGLNEEILAKIEQPILIPMNNQVESLNLAVSAGIILFEARRQNYI